MRGLVDFYHMGMVVDFYYALTLMKPFKSRLSEKSIYNKMAVKCPNVEYLIQRL